MKNKTKAILGLLVVAVAIGATFFFVQSSSDLEGRYRGARGAKLCEQLKEKDPKAYMEKCVKSDVREERKEKERRNEKDKNKEKTSEASEERSFTESSAAATTGTATFSKHVSSVAPCPTETLVSVYGSEVYCLSVSASGGDVTINDLVFESVPTALDNSVLASANSWTVQEYDSSGTITEVILAQGNWNASNNNVSMALYSPEIVADGTTSYFLLRAPITFAPDVISSTLATRLYSADTLAPSSVGSNGLPTEYLLLSEAPAPEPGEATFSKHVSPVAPCPTSNLIASLSSEVYCFSASASGGDITFSDLVFESVPTALTNTLLANNWTLQEYQSDGTIISTTLGQGTWDWATNSVSMTLFTPEAVADGTTSYYLLRAPIEFLPDVVSSTLATRLNSVDSVTGSNGLPTEYLLLSEAPAPAPGTLTFDKHTSFSAPCPSSTLVASSSSEVYCFTASASGGDATFNNLLFESVPTALDTSLLSGADSWELYEYEYNGVVIESALGEGSWNGANNIVGLTLFSNEAVADGTTSYYLLRAPISFVPDVISSTLATRLNGVDSTTGPNGLPTAYLNLSES